MNGAEFLASLPRHAGQAREDAIFEAMTSGCTPGFVWCEVPVSHGTHSGTVFVASRSFMVGDTDPALVNVSHLTAQRIVDRVRSDGSVGREPVYEAVLPTAKLSDLRWNAAPVKLRVWTQPSSGTDRNATGYSKLMDDTDAMVRHSRDVLGELEDVPLDTLVSPMGKDWCWTNKLEGHPERSAEYGLQPGRYQGVTPGVTVWQPGPSLAHEATYTDYSMCPAPVRTRMLVDGEWKNITDVGKDPELHWLVSSEGPLRITRHPGVPRDGETTSPAKTQPLFTRTLKRGCIGDDVRVWQGVVMAKQDGVFGLYTEQATKNWQYAHRLKADGIVGPMTRAAAQADLGLVQVPTGTNATDFDLGDMAFVPAVNYTKAVGRRVRLVVLHTMQAAEKPSTAEAVANWFAGKSGKAPEASSHLCCDNDSVVECVKPGDVAWAAPGANRDGYQVEHAGYARQTAEEWRDPYSEQMLVLSAKAVRKIAVEGLGIPARHLSDAELARGAVGFVDHHAVTRVYRKSTHTDVGNGFPWDHYLDLVEQ